MRPAEGLTATEDDQLGAANGAAGGSELGFDFFKHALGAPSRSARRPQLVVFSCSSGFFSCSGVYG